MKHIARKLTPRPLLERYRRWKRDWNHRQNRRKSAEEVFTQIYETNGWGGGPGEFRSGSGTASKEVVSAYVARIFKEAKDEGFLNTAAVDLGCGDFRVGQQLLPLFSAYVGVDVVAALIESHQRNYGNSTTRFAQLDVVQDEIPNGDVCFLRQVLQHLSNDQIADVLPKLQKYRWVYITEHYPSENRETKPNLDKAHGADIRLYQNSGVYLTEPPFSLPERAITAVLEVQGRGLEGIEDQGMIRTFRYKPRG